MPYHSNSVTAVIPAFNEAESIGAVVSGLRGLEYAGLKVVDHIVVCDNASDDGTAAIAQKAGALTCSEFRQGYGFACLRALEFIHCSAHIHTDIIIFVDGDYSAVSSDLPALLDNIIAGSDLVVGSRVHSLQEKGALGAHQQMGNVVASALIRWIWGVNVTDLGPLRAMRYRSLRLLNMQDQRFGWTVEMQVKAIQANMQYSEVPVSTRKRLGKSKISGTVRGTVGAFFGIFGKIARLYFAQPKFKLRVHQARRALPKAINKPHPPPL